MGRFVTRVLVVVALGALAGCETGGLPEAWRRTPDGVGPRIRWDLEAEPVADIPLPNDIATWPDPGSPTGLRLNPSQLVPTSIEHVARENLLTVDGWGTYAPIMIPFEGDIDAGEFFRRQGGTGALSATRMQEHAVYVIDLETGAPVPLDVNAGNFPYALPDPNAFFDSDPRAGESNVLFETVEEDLDGDGALDPGEDTDFDGVLDHPNTFSGLRTSDPYSGLDDVMWFYERETGTLYLKPILPMRPEHRYAVVVTDRMLGANGQPVRSPFDDAVHPLAQREALAPLPRLFAEHPNVYGDLATRGWEGVAFAWSFTTGSTSRDLDTLREGLYGRGAFSWIGSQFPATVVPAPMQGAPPRITCERGPQTFIAPGDKFRSALSNLLMTAFELSDDQSAKVLGAYAALDHAAVMFFETPYLLGNPDEPNLDDVWHLDPIAGTADVGRETISAVILVPKETATRRQPFPVLFYVHGHGSTSVEALPFGGFLLQHGIAIVLLNANGHGVETDPLILGAVQGILGTECLAPTADAILAGRARDVDGDRRLDSGVNFWTGYMFHTRDEVRQTILDHMRAIQILRSFDGRPWPATPTLTHRQLGAPLTFTGDVDGDGDADVFGDFDGDGTPDLGGRDQHYYFTGGSLGGITTGVMMGVEPAVSTAVPIVGGGGLSDIAVRTSNGTVRKTMHLRLMSPLVHTTVSAGPGDDSACVAGQVSLRVRATDFDDDPDYEFACAPAGLLDGDDVLVVRNARNGLVRCAGATRGEVGKYRVGVASDEGDGWIIEIYRDALMRTDFATCRMTGDATPAHVVDTFQVGNGREPGECPRCARFPPTTWEVGDTLVSPTTGLGYARQTPDVRRGIFTAQLATEPADPINYARRVFLEPVRAVDVVERTRGVLVANSVGDTNVCLNVGNAYARAAGILPFVPPDGPDELAEWRAPESFTGRYPGLATPNDVLIANHVLEGVARLARHPTADTPAFLVDVDDLSDGRMVFTADGQHQMTGGIAPPRLAQPLRWVRQSRPMTGPGDSAVWDVGDGQNVSAMLNYYVIPAGTHGFDEIIYPTDVPFDLSQYVINLIARYVATDGTDVRYHTDPAGHLCMVDSSCDFLQELRE